MITGNSPGKLRHFIDVLQKRLRQFLIEDASASAAENQLQPGTKT